MSGAAAASPYWAVPMELIRALVNGDGAAALVRLTLKQQAVFKPHAVVHMVDGRFVADVSFEEPRYPGRIQDLTVLLQGAPQENGR